ncbi:MAG: hypothetical protein AUJ71_03575 [Candidatus Omnitrophica bacterium CG1_02_49_16]|nr:MAG: hypothetical protein AUJ71_03575 [Candidatus Omnitrophica bacterium CG1_02_49_16]
MYLITADRDLRLYKECERCFWLNYKSRLPRPLPPPSLFEEASRHKLHEYFDKYRGQRPPDMTGDLEGVLVKDTELIGHWRSWHKGLRHSDSVMSAVLCGALDDCLVQDEEYYTPIVFRLVPKEPHENDVKDCEAFLDSLTYLLTANGYKTLEFGYAIFCYPESVVQHHSLLLKKKVVRIDSDVMRAEKLFYAAAELLRRRACPEEDATCPDCAWFNARVNFEESKK